MVSVMCMAMPHLSAPAPTDEQQKPPSGPGVYVAWGMENGCWTCVYVGESKLISRRVADRPELDGARLTFLCTDMRDRKAREAFFIGLLNPRLNGQSSVNCDPHWGARQYAELIWKETVSQGARSKTGSAFQGHVAMRCFLREKVIRAAWKRFQKDGKLVINNNFAVLGSGSRVRGLARITTV